MTPAEHTTTSSAAQHTVTTAHTEKAPAKAKTATASHFGQMQACEGCAAEICANHHSLRFQLAREINGRQARWQSASAEEIFGAQSTRTEVPAPIQSRMTLTDNAVFQGFVLLLAVTYALLLYHNMLDIRALLGRISRDTAAGKRIFEDPGGSGFSRFMNLTTAIGMLFGGVFVVKYGDSVMPASFYTTLSHGAVLTFSLIATAVFALVVGFQWILLHVIGALTLNHAFVAQLQMLRQLYFSICVILISPTLLLFALCPQDTGGFWFLLIITELLITLFLYLKETVTLFISKKIAILHWILYLCGVEAFPISLIWLLATR